MTLEKGIQFPPLQNIYDNSIHIVAGMIKSDDPCKMLSQEVGTK